MSGDKSPRVPRILTLSSLYPSKPQPQHGIFVEQRLRRLVESGQVQARVVAPVPWFPLSSERFGRYAQFAAIPEADNRHSIEITYPRYLTIPKFGMSVAPWLMANGIEGPVRHCFTGQGRFDLIDAHYFYPDGVAAAILARKLGVPLVVTARGSDINLIANYRWPRRRILWAADQAAAIIAVSSALRDKMVALGVDGSKISVLRNGVDLKLFELVDQDDARQQTGGWNGRWLLSVGNLVELKGHALTIEALQSLPGMHLAIVGGGPLAANLRALAARLGVADRVRFLGAIDQHELPRYYNAADALVLVSSREGMPNVLLEAIACGLPAVATSVGGIPEIIATPEAGVLLADRSVAELVKSIRALFDNYPDRRMTRRYAESFGWEDTTRSLIALFRTLQRKY